MFKRIIPHDSAQRAAQFFCQVSVSSHAKWQTLAGHPAVLVPGVLQEVPCPSTPEHNRRWADIVFVCKTPKSWWAQWCWVQNLSVFWMTQMLRYLDSSISYTWFLWWNIKKNKKNTLCIGKRIWQESRGTPVVTPKSSLAGRWEWIRSAPLSGSPLNDRSRSVVGFLLNMPPK